MIEVNTQFKEREKAWTFSGRSTWKEIEGYMYSPMYSNPLFDRGDQIPNLYADYALYEESPEMRFRWEQAYPTLEFFTDIDASMALQQYYSSGAGCGLIFRALDSVRFYSVEVTDMGRKGHDYRVALMVSDASGYSTELACGYAPHSVMGEDFIHGRIRDREMWEQSSPDPVTLRVKTEGKKITVFMDGRELFAVEDDTYEYGATGVVAAVDAPIKVSDYRLQGQAAPAKEERWEDVETSGFVRYPVPRHRVGGWYGNPLLHRAPDGEIIMAFSRADEGPATTWRSGNEGPAFTSSGDEGKTWSDPRIICRQEGYRIGGTVLAHEDGSWSFIGEKAEQVDEQHAARSWNIRLRSSDRGKTWSEMEELEFGGRKVEDYGWREFYLYSAPFRISDGAVLMTGYRSELMPGAEVMDNTTRRDQSFVVRSTDDGKTWGAPILIDTTHFDTNECMIAEPRPGKLVSFSRTLRGRHMWTSTSVDGGMTWSALEESSVPGECPYLLSHSSGAIVMTSRDFIGNSVRVSFDEGKTWTRPRRVPVSGMANMAELEDGRVLIAGHTGWANPTWIHCDTFRVTPDGPVAER